MVKYQGSPTFAPKKTMGQVWIKTEQMLEAEGATGAEKRSEKFGCVELNAYLCTRKDGLS